MIKPPSALETPPELNIKSLGFFVVRAGGLRTLIITLSVVAVATTVEYCISIRRATIIPRRRSTAPMQLIDERKYLGNPVYRGRT